MCLSVLCFLHIGHSVLLLRLGMCVQKAPSLYISCVCFHRKSWIFFVMSVRGTAWYSLATRGLVMGGGVGGGVGRMVCCNSYSNC